MLSNLAAKVHSKASEYIHRYNVKLHFKEMIITGLFTYIAMYQCMWPTIKCLCSILHSW